MSEDELERLSFEVVVSLPVDQFEKALADDSILLDEEQLRTHLRVIEHDHVRHSVRAKVFSDSDPSGEPVGYNPAIIEELERRAEAIKERLNF